MLLGREVMRKQKERGRPMKKQRHKCVIMLKEGDKPKEARRPGLSVDPQIKKKCTRIMTESTVKNGNFFSIIDDAGLKDLAEFFISVGANFGENANVDTLLPQPDTISRNIRNLYDSHFDEIQEEILAHKKFGYGITSNIWTDDKTSYLSLTIQYIKEGAIINRLLAVKSIDSST
ncbi:maker421, partial [Drosophila busckii]